jgi:predicted AAA+ superfamily ATPase
MNKEMDKNQVFQILEDWNFWRKELDTGIPRKSYLERLQELAKTNHVITITGPRRSGKSYLLRQFAHHLMNTGTERKNILILNLEDPRFPPLDAQALDRIFKIYLEFLRPEGKLYLFLDEIQEVNGWEKWASTLHELKKANLMISGSNAKLLGRELGTLLTGRHLDLTVFPLSFKEYLSFHNIQVENELDQLHHETTLKGLARKYMEEGAYPEVVLSEKPKEILLNYFEDVIHKDLVRRYRIRKEEPLKSLARFYLTQMSSLSTYNATSKFLSLTTSTIEKYSHYLETAYLLFFVKRFSFKFKEQEKSPRKVYSVDTGLANTLGFRFLENRGRAAENLVLLELMRRKALNPSLEIYYWKDALHQEVDFIVKEGLKVQQMIQVCWNVEAPQTRNREIRALLKAMEEFKVSTSLVITEDQESEEKINDKRILFQPLWKWLLTNH